jgi:hypothetical protein
VLVERVRLRQALDRHRFTGPHRTPRIEIREARLRDVPLHAIIPDGNAFESPTIDRTERRPIERDGTARRTAEHGFQYTCPIAAYAEFVSA